MSVPTGTYLRYDVVGDREDLQDVIFNISPVQTPFLSGLGRGKCDSTLHEWQTDELSAADPDNAQLEGDDTTFSTPSPTVRVGNYTQISRKEVVVSGTLERIKKAGRKSELAYQTAKRGKELKRDMESGLLENQGGVGGSAGVARRYASMGAWLKTNTDFDDTTGEDPTYTEGVPGAARTDSSAVRALTETIAKGVIQSAWAEGGEPNVIMVGPFNKQRISEDFAGIASHTVNVDRPGATHVAAAVDIYASDFGNLRIVPNRFQRERDAWFLDFSLLRLKTLRPMFRERLAKTGDNQKWHLIVEYTLEVGNEAGLGGAFDLESS